MLTTGDNNLDSVYKKSNTINSTHKIIAEWNKNSYTDTIAIGSYPIYLDGKSTGSADPNYSKTFNVSETVGGWDNGGYYLTINKGGGITASIEHKDKKETGSLTEIIGPNRPDPGIIYGFGMPNLNNNIINDCNSIKTYNILNSDKRLYPLNKSQTFKYWTSSRYNKPNSTVSPANAWGYIGTADVDGKMKGNNVFVVYDDDVEVNKIVIKTQTANGFAQDYTVEVLLSGDETNTWTKIYQEIGATTPSLLDGIVRLTGKTINDEFVWSIAQGVETENAIDDLYLSNNMDLQIIRGIRFSVQKISTVSATEYIPYFGGTLDLIEISPRMVVDLSSYTSSFSISTSIGDAALGLPTGSIVSAQGSLELFNDENIISERNPYSILFGMLKPNVKFTFLNVIKDDAGEINGYVPLKVMYSKTWDETADWNVQVELEDYMKFLKDAAAPDILLGTVDGVRVSAILKILLDNVGFTRFTFKKTSNDYEYDHEDRRIDFFYSSKESSLGEILNEIATSTQLSIFFDNTNTLVAMTKEAVTQKRSDNTYDYWFVGDSNNAIESDPEYSYINGNYISNIESFEDSVILPITTGEVTYQSLGINKDSLFLTKSAITNTSTTSPTTVLNNILDSGLSQLTLNRNWTYVPKLLWEPSKDSEDAYLSAGVLSTQDISAVDPMQEYFAETNLFEAKDEYDAIRIAYAGMTPEQKKAVEIVLQESNLTVDFKKKYSGYLLVDNEMIKYNGIVYIIDRPGYAYGTKIYFSETELNSDKSSAQNGSWFIPYCLLTDLNMKITAEGNPTIVEGQDTYIYECIGTGRGFNSTPIENHTSGINNGNNGWVNFATRLYSASTSQPAYPAQLSTITVAQDSGITANRDSSETLRVATGYATLSGPPSKKTQKTATIIGATQSGGVITYVTSLDHNFEDQSVVTISGITPSTYNFEKQIITVGEDTSKFQITNTAAGSYSSGGQVVDFNRSTAAQDQILFDDVGQEYLTGVKKDCGFVPTRIGTRMRIIDQTDKITESFIGGLGFFLSSSNSGTTGYFVEVSTLSEAFDPVKPQSGNVVVYKVTNVGGIMTPKALAYGASKIQSTTELRSYISSAAALLDSPSWRETFDLDIITYLSGGNRVIEVWVENIKLITATDTSPITQTSNIGAFIRDDSEIVLENIYAATVPNGETVSVNSPIYNTERTLSFAEQIDRGFMSSTVRTLKGTTGNHQIFYEDFGNLVREARKINARFNFPAFSTKLIELSRVAQDYIIKDYESSSFGASFWIYNTSQTTVSISGDSPIPVFISGIPVSKLSEGHLKIEDYLESIDVDERPNDQLIRNKNLYGQQSITINGPYINNYEEAKALAAWVSKKASKEKISISASIFPNPLLQLGDTIKLFYKDRGYNITSTSDDKSFVLSELNYSVTSSGIDMNVGLREKI